MKKTILAVGIILMTAFSCNKPQSGYTVNGDVAGAEGTIYMTVFEGKQPVRIDSVASIDGKFTFKGDRPIPILASLELEDGVPFARFFLENNPIELTGTIAAPNNIIVSGSATNDLYNKYKKNIDSIRSTSDDAAATAASKAFVAANPNSVAAAYVLYRDLSYSMPYQELEQTVASFDPSIQNSVYVKLVADMVQAMKNTAVGQKFTDISAPDKEGNMIALSSMVGDGKYVLLDFWASWCPPCREDLPHLLNAYKKFHPKGFEIYAVSLDRNRDEWLKIIDDMDLSWTQVSDLKFWESNGADMYGIRSIPSNILIAPDGTIVARNLFGEALQNKLQELLNAE